MVQPFISFILPVSGTDFVRYDACLSILAEYRKSKGLEPLKPQVIYAASGGCLTAYKAMMSSFTSRIENWSISSDMFVDRPTPFTPRLLTFALHGYLYHRTNISEYVRSIFVPALIQDVEIVTGFYEQRNPDTYKHTVKIVTNMDKARSVFATFVPSCENIIPVFADAPPVKPDANSTTEVKKAWKDYLDSVVTLSIDALHKTSNIPFMMEPLGEAEALDYGIVAPSPRVITNGDPNKSIYFSPVDIDRRGELKNYQMIFHQVIMNDIACLRNSFNSCKCFANPDPLRSLDAVMSFIDGKVRYCLILYTTAMVDIPIHSFSEKTVWFYVQGCKTGVKALLLYDA